MENIIIKETTIQYGKKINGKYHLQPEMYHFIHFSDEDTISINLLKEFKHAGHYETKLKPEHQKILNMESGQLIEDENGQLISCIMSKEEIIYTE